MKEVQVSIVLRSFNEAWGLRETLPALEAQNYRNWELIAFDSGSTDGSVEMIRRARPRHFVQLLPHEYRPGRVLNQAMDLASQDRVIFLNADATPQGADWLGPLVGALADPRVAAAFGRQIPRPDCEAAFARDYERCFGYQRESARWDHFFSMVSSGLRRDVWAYRRFKETMQYSEDDEYTRWCRSEGYEVRYCPNSIVMHSHNYTPRQAYKRSFGEAWALATLGDGPGRRRTFGRSVLLGWLRDAADDLRYCGRHGRLGQWRRALAIRWQQRLGRLHGFQAGWQMQLDRRAMTTLEPREIWSGAPRFTRDGDEGLESHLDLTCARVLSGIRGLIPPRALEAVLLGGGYGRGEGGVRRDPGGDRPYNDLEFYVLIRGSRHLGEFRYQRRLEVLAEILTHLADVEVEFKLTTVAELAARPVSMFSYDLVVGHRVLWGRPDLGRLPAWEHHRHPEDIPPAEATRLLMNRCSGLLFARTMLSADPLASGSADFVRRNIAKAQLACGDAVLTVHGRYHWSCRERHRRLKILAAVEPSPWLETLVRHHAAGVDFKFHPATGPVGREELAARHREVTDLAQQCWLWLESRRLGRPFSSARAYAEDAADKCPDSSPLRDLLLNLRADRLRPRARPGLWRHPRQRIFHSLALLLWEPSAITDPQLRRRVRAELNTRATSADDCVDAYRALWCRVR